MASPCKGRPPVSAFHSYDLARSLRQFDGYSLGEQDLTRYNFRKAIIDSGVTAVAFAVSVEDWNEILPVRARAFFGDPERWIAGIAIKSGCDLAREHKLPISFQFDIQRKSEAVEQLIQIASEDAPDISINVGFSPVAKVAALQAADMVAHQTYQHFLKLRKDPDALPDPHMLRLMEDAYDWGVKIFSKEGMEEMARVSMPLLDEYDEQVRRVLASQKGPS